MKKFGYELRKIGNVKALYDDVDMILSKHEINPQDHISKMVQTQTASHMLHKMFKPDRWVDVCNIKTCASLCCICIKEERMEVYNIAHCMHWSEMTEDYRELLMAMIMDDFRCILNVTEETKEKIIKI